MDKQTERLHRRQIRPTTPGEFLKEDVLPELDISQVAFAERLGVPIAPFPKYLMSTGLYQLILHGGLGAS